MKRLFLFLLIGIVFFPSQVVDAQEKKVLSFEDVLYLASTQSTNALMAKHRFRSSYWHYRSFKAEYLPSLSFRGTAPSYSRSYQQEFNSATSTYEYYKSNILSSKGTLSLSQNIGLTGGSVAVNTSLAFQDNIDENIKQFVTEPLVNVALTQPILKYNVLRWEKKIQPLQYEIAKKVYIADMEDVNALAVRYFFQLALAQINVEIAKTNQTNSDTLYRVSEGRYQLGTIAENELLQMKLKWLNAENNLKQARMNLRDQENRMRSFLGFNDNVKISLNIPYEIPEMQIDAEEVLSLAFKNNPEVFKQELEVLQSKSRVAQAKAERGFSADLTVSYGLSDQSRSATYSKGTVVTNPLYGLRDAYTDPDNSQVVKLTLSLPILDWGQRKGSYKMALSSLELAEVKSEQTLAEFEADLLLDVEQFNLQYEQVMIAAQSDTVAQRMYKVSKARYIIGSSSVLELNNADSEKDRNRRAYIQAIQTYWSYFYNVRRLAMFDFLKNKPIEVDFDSLVD